ncbi:pyridine nucleotide-disulfide oxidoreductase, partial [Arthrobacter sp. KK5.5]
ASRRLHLHFLHNPIEVLGEDGKVSGMRFERQELDGSGNVRGTGEILDYPFQAVYRAIGYFGSAVEDVEYDGRTGTIPNAGGRVLGADGVHVPGIYATGWIKRGPVGLIGHTKGDALETVTHLLSDLAELPLATDPATDAVVALLESKGIEYTTWDGWLALDEHEKQLGADAAPAPTAKGPVVRERVKVVERGAMVSVSRGATADSRA